MAIKFGEITAREAEERANELAELEAEKKDIERQIEELDDRRVELQYEIYSLRSRTGI